MIASGVFFCGATMPCNPVTHACRNEGAVNILDMLGRIGMFARLLALIVSKVGANTSNDSSKSHKVSGCLVR